MSRQAGNGFDQLPDSGSWRHVTARAGFEVAFFDRRPDGFIFEGTTTAYEEEPWTVGYSLLVGTDWVAREGRVTSRTRSGARQTEIRLDATGWWVDGCARPDLNGCYDIDLESSAVTNAFPVHRLGLDVGDVADAPAAFVRAVDLSVERLEQRYYRLPDSHGRQRFHYESPAFQFECELRYDASGLVLDYPGIARRHH
ncbi:MAG TPA: putative glycolipid-binding domain-containing protein [Glaciibacter sp.]|nr:putative glycolipid-binding domain-containing protein [Glaciibacter sp.]